MPKRWQIMKEVQKIESNQLKFTTQSYVNNTEIFEEKQISNELENSLISIALTSEQDSWSYRILLELRTKS